MNALTELEELKFVIRTYEINAGKTMEEVFKEYDHEKAGTVSKIAFTYIMTKVLNVTQVQVESLIDLLWNGKSI